MRRATGNENVQDLIIKLSDGNPGAITVLAKLISYHDFASGLFLVLWLDELGIYGSNIWVLYKDWCFEDIGQMILKIKSGAAKILKENGQLEG